MKDNKNFRYQMLQNEEFKNVFLDLVNRHQIKEFSEELWNIIKCDKTKLKSKKSYITFEEVFLYNINNGTCFATTFELSFLLKKLGISSTIIQGLNKNFIGSAGSPNGGHYWLYTDKFGFIDTSLMITGSFSTFNALGHREVRKITPEEALKAYNLYNYYDNMVVMKEQMSLN